MRAIADENIPLRTVRTLRELGHEVTDLRTTEARGLADDDLWRLAQDHRAILITTDKGFCRFRDENHFGILVVRLRQPNRERIHARVLQLRNRYRADAWPGLLVVVRDQVFTTYRARA